MDLKRENEGLRERLRIAISQMAGSVDANDVNGRLETATSERDEIQKENNDFKDQLEKWKADFREERDGREPTEDDRFVFCFQF